MDNRISRFCGQHGRCAVSGYEFKTPDEIRCHHIIPEELGGTDKYQNLVLIRDDIHTLLHASLPVTIKGYLQNIKLQKKIRIALRFSFLWLI
ncbi:MAG: HNH endonuclease [Clostridiales bacterium]|nr:HNH endonuclease [Clostridiales bacterium]